MSNNILEVFDGGSVANIVALIDKLAESSFDYLELEDEGMRIVIGKNGVSEISGTAAAKAETPAKASTEQPAAVVAGQAAEEAPQEAAPAPEQRQSVAEQAGVAVIRSPSYGMYYAQQEPGAPPFIRVGEPVKKGDTVGLLEIMKTYNAVTSPVDGKVIAIHVANGELLEPDQPLCSVQVN
jgi:acetyl-CoA carboxylase biotin carboxyl carrier protein